MTGRKVSHWCSYSSRGEQEPGCQPCSVLSSFFFQNKRRGWEAWGDEDVFLEASLAYGSHLEAWYHQRAPACCCPCLSHPLSHPQEFKKAPSAGLALTLFQGLPSCARCHFLLPYDTMSGSSKQRTSGLQSRGWTGYANGEGLVSWRWSMARTKASGLHGLIGLQWVVLFRDLMKEVGSELGLTDYPVSWPLFSSQHLLSLLLSSSGLADKELMGFQDAPLSVDVRWSLMKLPQLPNIHIFIEQLAPDHTSDTLQRWMFPNRRVIILKSFRAVESERKCDKGEFVEEENMGDEEKGSRMPQHLGFPFPQSVQLGLFLVVQGLLSRECMAALSHPPPPHTLG